MTVGASTIDFDLAGRRIVRLVDPAPADMRAVAARLGLAPQSSGMQGSTPAPLLVLRYVAELSLDGRLRTVGRDEGAYTDKEFVIRDGSQPIAVVPFEAIGAAGAEITVVRGSGAPARLVSLLNLAALGADRTPLHAAAVLHAGTGIAACGWSGSGKTEFLLGFMARGARYVGDEWVFASPTDGMTGLPQPVRVQDWHVDQLAMLRDGLGGRRRLRLAAAGRVRAAAGAVDRSPVPVLGRIGRLAGRLGGRPYVDLPPASLFGADAIASSVPLDRLILLETGLDDEIRIEPIDPLDVADRLALAHVHHRRALLGWYWQSRYGFPARRNALLERIEDVERERLRALFADRPAVRVEHPHHVSIPRLADEIERHLG